ncbi:unnamed protein product [Withania somnifera]
MLLTLRRTILHFPPKITLFPLPRLQLSTLSPSSSPFHQNPTNNLSPLDINNLILSIYHHGKFHNLLQNVVTWLSFLLTACHNLKPNSNNTLTLDFFSTHFFSLKNSSFNCTFIIPPSSFKVKSLLRNLKLKVVIEAVRMVLESIYDDRFNSVEDPSWWFTVCLNPAKFESKHVNKLCKVMEEKISDEALIGLIKKMCVEFDLINIYFNRFDKEIQELRLKRLLGNAFYKPLKIYAARYLDEILVITSETKMITMDLKTRLVQNVDRNKAKTVIHSATSEKFEFLGMEPQAIKPSVLHPPMSQKAIRARKKYLRQKEVKALELRNAIESCRKKLGMKIFSHVFKKVKCANGFKTDFQIESEVNQIFDSWAEEVMLDFLKSVDDRLEWYRMLSAGDFLSLKRIRNQLPCEIVDAYDNSQEHVDRYLNPVEAKGVLEEQVKIAEEEEKRKYSDQTIVDLTKLCIKVEAPLVTVKKAVKLVGFTNHMGHPRPISLLMILEDTDIIKWYAGIREKIYHLGFSCILTLAEKHEYSKKEAIKHYTKDLEVSDVDRVEEVHFPTEREVTMMGDNDLIDPKPVDGSLGMTLIRLASDEPSYCCTAHFNLLNLDLFDRSKWIPGMGSIHENLNKRCISLCSDHISELYLGRLTLLARH